MEILKRRICSYEKFFPKNKTQGSGSFNNIQIKYIFRLKHETIYLNLIYRPFWNMYFGGVRKDFNCAILRRFWSALSRVNKTSTDIYKDIQTTLLGFMPCIKFRLCTVIVRSDFYRAFQQCMSIFYQVMEII